jgi:hypothetical protein
MIIPTLLAQELAVVSVKYFQTILHRSPELLVNLTIDLEKFTDTFKLLDAVLKLLRTGSAHERLIGRSLMFIKQHYNLLRHTPQEVSDSDLFKVIENFNDLVQSLHEISQMFPEKRFIFNHIVTFATEYYFLCYNARMKVPPLLLTNEEVMNSFPVEYISAPPLSKANPSKSAPVGAPAPVGASSPLAVPAPPSSIFVPFTPLPGEELLYPPQGQTLEWYKSNQWRNFISGRTVQIQDGKHAGHVCQFDRWNRVNARFRFLDGKFHCITLQWSIVYA